MGAKYKPNKGCVKRFKVTATGKVKRQGTMSTHLRSVRSGNMKRRLGRPAILAEGHARNMRYFMGVSGKKPLRVAHNRAVKAAQGVEVTETAAA
ncbi:MAG: Ribosomal protein [Phycisphaerales bacterium]|nr:Ribosomal protein [Phycisphaerales bacterium]